MAKKKKKTTKKSDLPKSETINLDAGDCAVVIRANGKLDILSASEPHPDERVNILTAYYGKLCAWALGSESVQQQFLAMAQAKMQELKQEESLPAAPDDDSSLN